MVNPDIIESCNTALARSKPVVAVFAGGTSGIGEAGVRALAANYGNQGKGLRVYIIGRKQTYAETIIADCLKVCPAGIFRFVEAEDLALLRSVDQVCNKISRMEETESARDGSKARVDFLCLTQGAFSLGGRRDTSEGLDALFSLSCFSRLRLINRLLPLLLSSDLPCGATAVSVLSPSRENKTFYPDDLGLRDPKHYGIFSACTHSGYLTTFFMEHLATSHPSRLRCVYYYPGWVLSDMNRKGLPTWQLLLSKYVMAPIVRLWAVPLEECGQNLLFLMSSRFPAPTGEVGKPPEAMTTLYDETKIPVAAGSDETVGSGTYLVGKYGETVTSIQGLYNKARAEGVPEKVKEYVLDLFKEIEAGGVFMR